MLDFIEYCLVNYAVVLHYTQQLMLLWATKPKYYSSPSYATKAHRCYTNESPKYYTTTYAAPAYYTKAPKYYSAPSYYTEVSEY
jgi:hypothetical protein